MEFSLWHKNIDDLNALIDIFIKLSLQTSIGQCKFCINVSNVQFFNQLHLLGFNVHHPPFTSTPNASSTEEVQPYASTTRLRAEINASSTEDVQPYASTTPLRAKLNAPQPHQSVDNVEHLYSKVDRSAILKAVKDETRGASPERPLNPPYEDIRKYQRNENCDTPPPVPLRTIHDMDDLNEMDNRDDNEPYSSIQTTMSNNLDEGYSTVDDTKQRANKVCIHNI